MAVTLGLAVAVIHYIAMVGTWARWDSAGLQGPAPEWVKVTFKLLSFPMFTIADVETHGFLLITIGGRVIDLFSSVLYLNSALWGAAAALLYMRFSKRARIAPPVE